jgi:hypothetical protein
MFDHPLLQTGTSGLLALNSVTVASGVYKNANASINHANAVQIHLVQYRLKRFVQSLRLRSGVGQDAES